MTIPVIVLAVLILAAIVATIFCVRNWHWGQVVLVVAIILTGTGYSILVAKSIQIRSVMGTRINNAEVQIEDLEGRIDALERGTSNNQVISRLRTSDVQVPQTDGRMPSLADQQHALQKLILQRGRVWRQVVPAGFDDATGTVGVVIESPDGQHGLDIEQTVFAFEQGPSNPANPSQAAQYIGQFTVEAAGPDGVELAPAVLLSDAEMQRINASIARQMPWVLYEALPNDRHEVFAGLTDDELRQLLPSESVEEYIRHGEPATEDVDELYRSAFDAEGNLLGPDDAAAAANVTYLYDRPLRDYSYIFQFLFRRRVQMLARRAALQTDNALLDQTIASARQLTTYREQELQRLERDLAGTARDLATIEAHVAQLQALVARARELVNATLAGNLQMATALALSQAVVTP